MKFTVIVAAPVLALALGSCAQQPTKEQVGAATGAVVGGLLGSQIGQGGGRDLALIAGALAGAYVGSRIGKSMDETDRIKAARALETAPTGAPTTWRNPDTGNTYTVTPTQTYVENDQPCRDYTTRGVIDGREEIVHGTACRQPDGTWRAVSS
jgi:surface antigen